MAAEAPTSTCTNDPMAKARKAAGTPGTSAQAAMARSGEGLLLGLFAITHHDQVGASDSPDHQPHGQEHGVEARKPVDEEPDATPHGEAGNESPDDRPGGPIAFPRVLLV